MRTAINRKESNKNQRKSSFFRKGGEQSFFSNNLVQTKLSIGQPGDKYEQEADRMADYVVCNSSSSASETSSGAPAIQNKCSACEEKDKSVLPKLQKMEMEEESEEPVQLKSNGSPQEASKGLAQNLNSSKGGGMPLTEQTRNEMEASIGADFSSVRVHTGGNAVQMNQELGAQAFTNGSDVYFNSGKYSPESSGGKHLLAHELTHVVQQGAATSTDKSFASNENVQTKHISSVSSQSQGDTIQRAEDLAATRFSGNRLLERAFDGLSLISKTSNRSGTHVRLVQESLLALGYTLPLFGADGIFGDETDTAVRAFQIDAGATQLDGIIGSETMRLLDMQDPGGSVGAVGPSPVPATAAVFSEAPNETFAGYDASTATHSLVVPVNERRRANVAIAPATAIPTYVSDTPAVATVSRIDDGIVVTGISHGTANITAMEGATVLGTLQIAVKRQLNRTVAFHYVCDSAPGPAGPNCSNGTPSADTMRSLLNQVWHRQANIRFTGGASINLVAPGNMGPSVDDPTGFGGGEMGIVRGLGSPANYQVFRVGELTSPTICGGDHKCNGGYNVGNDTFIADASCGDGWGLPHECGHFLGLGHGSGFIMTPCGGRVNQRVSRAMADAVNV